LWRAKARNITYSEYVFVTGVIQNANGMPLIILSTAACPAPHFSKLSHKGKDILKTFFENKMCFDFLCDFCLKRFLLQVEFSEILS
jgi:hypothetical protein